MRKFFVDTWWFNLQNSSLSKETAKAVMWSQGLTVSRALHCLQHPVQLDRMKIQPLHIARPDIRKQRGDKQKTDKWVPTDSLYACSATSWGTHLISRWHCSSMSLTYYEYFTTEVRFLAFVQSGPQLEEHCKLEGNESSRVSDLGGLTL